MRRETKLSLVGEIDSGLEWSWRGHQELHTGNMGSYKLTRGLQDLISGKHPASNQKQAGAWDIRMKVMISKISMTEQELRAKYRDG